MKMHRKVKRLTSLAAAAAVLGSVCSAMPQTAFAADTVRVYYGDCDGNGKLNASDLSAMKQLLLSGSTAYEYAAAAGDVNKDGSVTAADAVMLQQYLLTIINSFPAGVYTDISTAVTYLERYYAIEAQVYDGWEETSNEGFTGAAYINYNNVVGSYINWTVNVPVAGNYTVTFRYANGGSESDNRTCLVSANGSGLSTSVNYPYTGAWTTWNEVSVVLTLEAGTNTIKAIASGSGGGPNMDYIELEYTPDAAATPLSKEPEPGAYHVEKLDRGVVAANTNKGILISWRTLGTDDSNTRYEVFKNGQTPPIFTSSYGQATNYLDSSGTTSDWYTVDVYQGDTCTEYACFATQLYSFNSGTSGAYMDVLFTAPADMTMPDGTTCSYSVNDCSVGDIDGDGVYEIFVKWDPSNSQDNSKDGYTGNVFIDCYKLDGTRVWRIDLGRNIRAGAHYTQFLVYDFDNDNCAEMICKTADATVDGQGNVIGSASADYRSSAGRILTGPEYITLFDGKTGKALDTQNYDPARGTVGDWGDTYGNRVDRFTATVAYLQPDKASAVFGRGYYTRSVIAAWDVENHKLVKRWTFDTGYSASAAGYGDGNHHILAADCDSDGKQEIVVGSAVVDDNGKLLYTTGLAHGDAIHIGDFDLDNPGLEIFQCLEDESHPNGTYIGYGTILRDAGTGKVLFRETAGGDTGRALADNIVAGNAGAEMVGSHNAIVYAAFGNHAQVCTWADITKWGMNSVVYWDGTLERGVLDRTMVDKYGSGRIFTGNDVTYNNASKSNASLTCDLFGDWREEMIFPLSVSSGKVGVRIFTTTYTTTYGITTLMHDPQYRTQVAAQNNGYNQPPHLSYFLGTGFAIPEGTPVYTTD